MPRTATITTETIAPSHIDELRGWTDNVSQELFRLRGVAAGETDPSQLINQAFNLEEDHYTQAQRTAARQTISGWPEADSAMLASAARIVQQRLWNPNSSLAQTLPEMAERARTHKVTKAFKVATGIDHPSRQRTQFYMKPLIEIALRRLNEHGQSSAGDIQLKQASRRLRPPLTRRVGAVIGTLFGSTYNTLFHTVLGGQEKKAQQ